MIIMKRQIISWGMMLVAAFTLTNCAKEIENPNQQPEQQGYPFEIVASTVDTKTVNEGMATKWAEGDKINLFHAVTGGEDYINDANETLGAFTFTADDIFKGQLAESLTSGSYDWYALYPYSKFTTTPSKSGYLPIGCEPAKSTNQVQVGNSNMKHISGPNYPLWGNVTAIAHDERPSIPMSHVASLIKVVVENNTEEPLTVESVAFTAPVDVVGTYYITFNGDAVSCENSGEQYVSKTATLDVNEGEEIPAGKSADFYLAVRPFTAEAGTSLSLAVNGYAKEPKILESDVTFHAGKIKTLNFVYDYVAPAGEQSVTFDFTSADELNALGVTLPDLDGGTNVITLTKGDVTFVAEGGSTNTRVYNSKGNYDLRAYKGATLTFTVPTGYVISDIIVEGSATTGISKSTMPNNPVVLTVAADASTQKISTVTVKYIEGEVEAVPLTMTEIACVNKTANSLTFSWDAVTGAEGYKVSIDGGETYGDILTETSYTWVDLEPETEYTLYVKAIGNGVNTSDSEAVSCTETTDEELVGVEEVKVVIDLTKQGYSNQDAVTTVVKNPINVEFKQNTASNPPAYYTTGTAVRVYSGGYFTVSSDKTIVKVALTFGTGDGSNTITTDCGSFSTDTWTGSSNSVKFTVGGTSGHRRIQKLTITYQKAVGEVILESRDLKFSSVEASATMGKSFTAPTLSGVISDVTYTSSDAAVATVNATTGEVTLVAAGTTIITASAPETAEYEAGMASYTLTVNPASSAGTKTFTVKSDDIVSNSAYTAYSTTIDGRVWVITCGGNQKSVGVNSSNRSKCNLSNTNYTKYAVSPLTTSSTASAFASTTSISNVSKISYDALSGGSNHTATKIYVLYSEDGTTFSQLPLTNGTQGAAINATAGGEFEFASCSGYFAVVFVATNSSGNWRLDNVNLTFTYSE